jgi:perosamine synthetase
MNTSNLAISGGTPVLSDRKNHYIWPRITPELEASVFEQLHESLSLYNKSGIFARFETAFAHYHQRSYALVENAGTSALYGIYEGIGLGPGDEVIVPAYTFFATVSPLMHTGAVPIFCDCNEDGNIDPEQIESLITPRCKAIMITHMWGMPCDMDRIVQICQRHKLLLLEDCSHAHGARYKGKKVGTLSHAAAWSLQGQKIITGGEGGILLTDDATLYHRALLQGHYNNRCKQEIDREDPLFEFALTGFGLKLRAHPLAIAIAFQQFKHLDEWLEQKQRYAEQFIKALSLYPFLKMPRFVDKQPSWYAFIIQYDEACANGVSVDNFHRALLAEGLAEVDRPGSTRPIYNLPLFTRPHQALPRLYQKSLSQTQMFPGAETFYRQTLKLPVWAFSDEQSLVNSYIEGVQKVSDAVLKTPEILRTLS